MFRGVSSNISTRESGLHSKTSKENPVKEKYRIFLVIVLTFQETNLLIILFHFGFFLYKSEAAAHPAVFHPIVQPLDVQGSLEYFQFSAPFTCNRILLQLSLPRVLKTNSLFFAAQKPNNMNKVRIKLTVIV